MVDRLSVHHLHSSSHTVYMLHTYIVLQEKCSLEMAASCCVPFCFSLLYPSCCYCCLWVCLSDRQGGGGPAAAGEEAEAGCVRVRVPGRAQQLPQWRIGQVKCHQVCRLWVGKGVKWDSCMVQFYSQHQLHKTCCFFCLINY